MYEQPIDARRVEAIEFEEELAEAWNEAVLHLTSSLEPDDVSGVLREVSAYLLCAYRTGNAEALGATAMAALDAYVAWLAFYELDGHPTGVITDSRTAAAQACAAASRQ